MCLGLLSDLSRGGRVWEATRRPSFGFLLFLSLLGCIGCRARGGGHGCCRLAGALAPRGPWLVPPQGLPLSRGWCCYRLAGQPLCGLAAGLAPPGGPCKAQGRALVRRSKLALAALAALVKSSSAALVVPRDRTPALEHASALHGAPRGGDSRAKPQQDLAGGGERASWGRSDRRVAAVRARSRAAVAACAVVASGLPRRPSGKASSSPNPSARGGRPRARFEVDAPRRADRAEPPP